MIPDLNFPNVCSLTVLSDAGTQHYSFVNSSCRCTCERLRVELEMESKLSFHIPTGLQYTVFAPSRLPPLLKETAY